MHTGLYILMGCADIDVHLQAHIHELQKGGAPVPFPQQLTAPASLYCYPAVWL